MQRRLLLKLLPALALPLGPGCGYRLRGPVSAAAARGVHLQVPHPAAELGHALRRACASAGLELHAIEDIDAATLPVLRVSAERFSSRPASATPQARAAQVSLQLTLRITLHDGETALIDGESFAAEATYYQDLRNIAGNREEADLLREELRSELATQIVQRTLAALP